MLNFKLIRILIPIVLASITSYFCKIPKGAGNNVKFRPPSWVFGFVWPILYICIGISWYNNPGYNVDILFLLLNIILCLWIVMYGCNKNKKVGLYIIVLSILVCILLMVTMNNKLSVAMLSPLLVWLHFALLLNMFEVQSL